MNRVYVAQVSTISFLSTSLLIFQGCLIIATMLITTSSALSLQAKKGLPLMNQMTGWIVLGEKAWPLPTFITADESTFSDCFNASLPIWAKMPYAFLEILALLFGLRAVLHPLVDQRGRVVLCILRHHLSCLGHRGIYRSEWHSCLSFEEGENIHLSTG